MPQHPTREWKDPRHDNQITVELTFPKWKKTHQTTLSRFTINLCHWCPMNRLREREDPTRVISQCWKTIHSSFFFGASFELKLMLVRRERARSRWWKSHCLLNNPIIWIGVRLKTFFESIIISAASGNNCQWEAFLSGEIAWRSIKKKKQKVIGNISGLNKRLVTWTWRICFNRINEGLSFKWSLRSPWFLFSGLSTAQKSTQLGNPIIIQSNHRRNRRTRPASSQS